MRTERGFCSPFTQRPVLTVMDVDVLLLLCVIGGAVIGLPYPYLNPCPSCALGTHGPGPTSHLSPALFRVTLKRIFLSCLNS
jgi:hypothetical protein